MLKPMPWWLFWHNPTMWITLYPNIYYPKSLNNPDIFPDVIAHESVHLKQQEAAGKWWYVKYIFKRGFRLHEEAEAYAVQFSMTGEDYTWACNSLASSNYLWAAKSPEEARVAIAYQIELLKNKK